MSQDTSQQRSKVAEAFNRNADPLEQYVPVFEEMDVDPFEIYIHEVMEPKDLTDSREGVYDRSIRQWKGYMDEHRHAACPTTDHVIGFVEYLQDDRENGAASIKDKVRILKDIYSYWQSEPEFPHPVDYNPFESALKKVNLDGGDPKKQRKLSKEEVAEKLDSEMDIMKYTIILMQLKLGLRASEITNIKISEITMKETEVRKQYPSLGTHDALDGMENAIYIPHDREMNKSERPRTLPLDEEVRKALLYTLLIRPDADEEWLFLSRNYLSQLKYEFVTDVWKNVFHPEYVETEEYDSITSHYGRHFFTTFWRVEKDLNRELIKYMRGDKFGSGYTEESIDSYIHTYYDDIESIYRDEVFKFDIW